MRCLYCGKELALLKRWTGGGEFCSDAHRQQYQEEYNQLALNRLLQAKPKADVKQSDAKASEARADAKPADTKARDAKIDARTKEAAAALPAFETPPAPPLIQATIQARVEAPPAIQPAAVSAPEPEPDPPPSEPEIDEEPAPAEAYGFLIEMPVPVDTPLVAPVCELGGFDQPIPPALPPQREGATWETALVAGGRIVFAPCMRVMDYVVPSGERRLELREFVRSLPAFKFDAPFDLALAGETGLLETSEESMEILIFPQPPQNSAPVWLETSTPFAFGYELGALVRTTFRTTGMEDKDEDVPPMPAEDAPEQIIEPIKPAAAAPTVHVETPVNVDTPVNVETPINVETPATPAKFEPAPVVPVRVVARPVSKPTFVRPAAVAVATDTPVETPSVKKSEPVPDLMTRPLPLVLHGLTAGRGKPVQVFQTAVAGDLEIQAPRSNALPLRPVMTLGPAPALAPLPAAKTEERNHPERTVVVKSDVKPEPRKPQGRPDPRFANGKTRKPEPPAQTIKEEPKPAPEVTAVATATLPPPAEVKKADPAPAEYKLPEPLARPTTSLDLGLPKLTVDSGGFWSNLPPAGKIGIAAVLVLAIVGLAIVALRGSGSTVVANGPQVVAGAPLPAMDSGWITDFGAETGVRREREISILRPSLNLSDYRLEFQAQIEGGKALGWVFRAKDGKNFYVAKLEVMTPGLEPKVDVVHFAVIDGQPQQHAQTPLPMKVRIDTLYKIRFDAVGDHFSTWVQDEKVDDWTDDRLKIGGVGLYSDRGETMPRPRSVSVVPLVIKR